MALPIVRSSSHCIRALPAAGSPSIAADNKTPPSRRRIATISAIPSTLGTWKDVWIVGETVAQERACDGANGGLIALSAAMLRPAARPVRFDL